MRILVIPTTDWTRHPVPNRLNFMFDRIAKRHEVYVIHFELRKFSRYPERATECELIKVGESGFDDLALYYLLNFLRHARIIKNVVREKKIDVIVCANIIPSFATTMVTGNVPLVFDYMDHL
jgi:hypothetical protein